MTAVPHPPYFSASPIEDKLKGSHFDTLQQTEAESQAMLNILTEHDFHDAFKNRRIAGYRAYSQKRTTSRVLVARRHIASF
jgi:hypothetical protein